MDAYKDISSSFDSREKNEIMRCVVDEHGYVIFASPALVWNLGRNTEELLSFPLQKTLKIISGPHSISANILDIESGLYEVALQRKNKDPVLISSRIDNIHLADNRNYIVFWINPNEEKHDFDDYKNTAKNLAKIASNFSVNNKMEQPKEQDESSKRVDIKNDVASIKLGVISKEDGELRHFLNLSNDLLAIYRRDGSFVRVNYSFNRVLGYTDSDLRQIPFIDLMHPDDRGFVCVEMDKLTIVAKDEEKRIDFQCRARCKDGGYRWIDWIQKSISGHIYIIGTDITDRKQHEAELLYREKQILEAQKIGRMGHWYWVVRDEHIDWSDNLFNIFGVEKGIFDPSVKNLRDLMTPEDANKIIQCFRKSIKEAVDCVLEFRIEVGETKEIRHIYCEGQCKIEESTGKVKALFGIMQDVTERKQNEEALQQAKEAAETAYSSKTRFLANMSHELRTPLNAIIGFSEMMQQQLLGPVGNERYLDYVGGIRESGEHLLNMINDILDMSKIEVGKYELELENFNISKLLQLSIHMVETRAHDGNVRLILDKPPESLTIYADRRAVMQIVLNLLSNAVKFTPDDGEVEISCEKIDKNIYLNFRDTGVGIPEDKIDLVVLPFEQVSSAMTRAHEGSGLGLAITKDLVKMHNGELHIKSTVNKGTTVTVIIPQTE